MTTTDGTNTVQELTETAAPTHGITPVETVTETAVVTTDAGVSYRLALTISSDTEEIRVRTIPGRPKIAHKGTTG